MSHTTTIDGIVITDVNALRGAVRHLQQAGVRVELKENVKPRAYTATQSGMNQPADFCLYLQDASYDVGLYRRSDGQGFEARTDFWNGSVEKVLGNKGSSNQARLGKLYQAYNEEVLVNMATSQGQNVSRHVLDDGRVQLRVSV